MNLQSIDKKLQAEFSAKKIKAEMKAENLKAYLKKVPVFAKLENLEKQLVFDIAKMKSDGKKTKEFEAELKTLRSEKKKILESLKIKESDLVPKYSCKICNDLGFIGSDMCECYKKRRNAEIIKACGLETNSLVSFADFDTKICRNEKQAKDLEKLKSFLTKWCEKYPDVKKRNIVLSGKVGVGKTFLSKCLAHEMLKKNYSVCFVSAFDMNNMMLKFHTTFDSSKQSHLVPLIESDILIIDDLGTEPITKNVTLNYLFLVLSERERFNRPVIVTTNLLPENILDRYGERIYSRLFSKLSGASLYVDGEDLRLSK